MKSSIDEFLIILDEANRVYSPGDNVHGKIIIKPKQDVKVPKLALECRGEAYVSWPQNYGTHTRYHYQREEYFALQECVYDQETANQDVSEFLQNNSYTFSFRVTIPQQDLPPSYESKHGSIRYCICAAIQNKNGKTRLKTERALFTIGNYEEFDEDELEEIIDNEKQAINGKDETVVLGSPCYPVGSVTISAHIDKILYYSGSTINITVRTDSETTKCGFDVHVALVRATKYKDTKGNSTFSTDKVKCIDTRSVTDTTSEDHTTELTIPHDVYPTMELACKCINVSYYIEVCLCRRNKSRKEATLMIPVIIISSSPKTASSSPSTSSSGIVADQSVSKKSTGTTFVLTGKPLVVQNAEAPKAHRPVGHYDNLAVSMDDEKDAGANDTNSTNRKRIVSLV